MYIYLGVYLEILMKSLRSLLPVHVLKDPAVPGRSETLRRVVSQ